MVPFASLPANLAAFCRGLNRDYRYRIGARELHDAARALEVTSIGNEQAVRDALRPVLASNHDDVLVFDEAFDAFFHPADGRGPAAQRLEPTSLAAMPRTTRRPQRARDDALEAETESDVAVADAIDVERDDTEEEQRRTAARLRALSSSLDGTRPSPELRPVDTAWRTAARCFVRRIEVGPARAWRPSRHGPRFDLRRSLRTSLQTGGELVVTRWRARPRRHPRLVMFIDGSRSMSASVGPPLRLAVALAGATSDTDVFVFSTVLRRITPDVRLAARGLTRPLPLLEHAWGGGTSIGACLTEFTRGFGDRLLSRRTVLVIASDGLDTGAPALLRSVMSRLQRLTVGIIWLNPLLDTPGYQPTAAGMRAALPSITSLAWVEDPAGLGRVARTMRLRR